MKFSVPESDQSSSPSTSFFSAEDFSAQATINLADHLLEMADSSASPQLGDVDMTSENPQNITTKSSVEELQGLVRLLIGRNTQPKQNSSGVTRRDVSLAKWDGDQKEFPFYVQLLEARIEEELDRIISDKSICLDMVNSLPVDKRPRVTGWFNDRSEEKQYNWRELVQHFRNEFEDKQAKLAASEKLLRMEQNDHQLFSDFIKDFEYQVAISGGNRTWTPSSKVNILNAAINNSLRKALVPVKLPSEDYSLWVAEVKEVADKLEALPDYQPKGSIKISTRLGPPKSGSVLSKSREPEKDSDGDVIMRDVDSILSALSNLLQDRQGGAVASVSPRNNPRPNKGSWPSGSNPSLKPPALWRSKEFERLIEKRLCVRCCRSGHIGRDCRKYSLAKRPGSGVNVADIIQDDKEEKSSDSGNEEP
ncbi:hypothetical protein K3495_g12903 [Podosphaera aphanis]|nr:hypothetical protein K3495_g12903 [Podosphaera aphanis]